MQSAPHHAPASSTERRETYLVRESDSGRGVCVNNVRKGATHVHSDELLSLAVCRLANWENIPAPPSLGPHAGWGIYLLPKGGA